MSKQEFKENFEKLNIKPVKIYKYHYWYAAKVANKEDWLKAIGSKLFFDELITISRD